MRVSKNRLKYWKWYYSGITDTKNGNFWTGVNKGFFANKFYRVWYNKGSSKTEYVPSKGWLFGSLFD